MVNKITDGYTHKGVFHADDVFSAVLLKLLNRDIKFHRVARVPDEVRDNPNAIVFDVGLGAFDHHQQDALVRENGVKYAAFGLLWKQFGSELIESKDGQRMFDEWFIQPIDAQDNGQKNPGGEIPIFSLSNAVSLFNPNWDEDLDQDAAFENAVGFMTPIFCSAIESVKSKLRAKEAVEAAIEQSMGGILRLSRFMAWQEWLFKSQSPKAKDILYVVFPSTRGDFTIQAAPKELGSFELRKPFPEKWRGRSQAELYGLTGIPELTFCHKNGFLCAATHGDAALKVAKLAVEAKKGE